MRYLTLIIVIMIIGIGTPMLIVYLLDLNIFSFASGEVDSWIMFWGSYIGSIIGASVVYFVARMQMKNQYEQQMKLFKLENVQQIKAIEMENKQSVTREMTQFLITTRLKKYEESIDVCENLVNLLMKMGNDFTKFVTYTDIINNRERPSKEEELKEKVYLIKNNHRHTHEKIVFNISKLNTLTNYSNEIEVECTHVIKNFNNMWDEAKKCYLDSEAYKEYLKPNERFLLNQSEETLKLLTSLIFHFNDKINKQLEDIERKIVE